MTHVPTALFDLYLENFYSPDNIYIPKLNNLLTYLLTILKLIHPNEVEVKATYNL